MQQHIGQLESQGIQTVHLVIGHEGQPDQGVPIGIPGAPGIKGPFQAVLGQALLHLDVFRDVRSVVKYEKILPNNPRIDQQHGRR